MKQIARSLLLFGSLALYPLIDNEPARAQIAPDGTLSTTVTTPDGSNFTIEDGDRAGGNLFHSFSEFSVPTNGSASFNNALDVQNIINRVTGGSVSNIDGLIEANCCANVFLLNPAGIIFGPNASLSIGGSFFGSTADSLVFPEGEFSATDTQSPPLLTINAPIGLNFRDNPEDIAVNGSSLEVNSGKTFALVGGNVNIEGGEFGFIEAPGGRVELGGLSAAGAVGLNGDGSLSFPEGIERGDVSLSNFALVDVSSDGGGSIAINARNIDIVGGEFGESQLRAGIASELGSPEAQAGDITLDATGALTIANNSIIENSIFSGASGNAGNINIQTKTLNVNNSQVGSIIYNKGKGTSGNLTVNASDSIDLSGEIPGENGLNGPSGFPGGLLTQADFGGEGQSGNINIETNRLNISNGSKVQVANFGIGNAGNLTIRASEINVFNTPDANNFFATTINTGVSVDPRNINLPQGNGGNLTIETDRLSIRNGGSLTANTQGDGNAGNITIFASQEIQMVGGGIIDAGVEEGASGNGGNLTINTNKLSLNNSLISTSTDGEGNAGNLIVNASESIELNGEYLEENGKPIGPGGLLAQVDFDGKGKGGNLTVETKRLSISNGSKIQAATFDDGDAGNIEINASEIDVFNTPDADNTFPTEINAGSVRDVLGRNENSPLRGNGGNLTIEVDQLSIRNGAAATVDTNGQGNAGNVKINANGTISVDGFKDGSSSRIASQVGETASGNAGGVDITTKNLSITNAGFISTSTFREGDAGNIKINASDSISIDRGQSVFFTGIASQVVETAKGNAGEVSITTKNLSVTNGGGISADTFGEGDAGNLTINVENFTVKNSVVSAFTNSIGNAGNLTVNASKFVELSGEVRDQNGKIIGPGGLYADVNIEGQGNAGNLTINTKRLSVSDGSKIQASTFGEGNSGDLTIRASDIDVFETPIYNVYSTGIFTEVSQAIDPDSPSMIIAKGRGNTGNLTIETERLRIKDGGQVAVSTYGEGNAGSLTVKASDSIEVSGIIQNSNEIGISKGESFLAAEVQKGATGRGGNLKIETAQLTIANQGRISVASLDESGTAGNLDINADSIKLDRGTITAATSLGEGGNINLNVDESLTMRNNSRISAQAAKDADGGNININAGFAIAFPSQVPNDGSDIIANAVEGRGGNIDINTQQIFGLQERRATPGNGTNDIDASSEFGLSGEVVITNLVDDINQGVVESPDNVVEPESVTAQACSAAGGVARGESTFTITGRGGLPALATDPLNSDQIQIGGDDAAQNSQQSSGGVVTITEQPNPPSSKEIVPARGMIVNEKGEVVLTAYPTPNTSQRTPTSSVSCSRS